MIKTADTYTGSLNVKAEPFLKIIGVEYSIDEGVNWSHITEGATLSIATDTPVRFRITVKNTGGDIEPYFGNRIRAVLWAVAPGRRERISDSNYVTGFAAGDVKTFLCTSKYGSTGQPIYLTPGGYQITTEFGATIYDTFSFDVVSPTPPPVPAGDITRVELDGKLLPENGTLDWTAGKQATIKVYFKNTGNVASKFHIWVTDEDGVKLCDVTTSTEIPADGVERYVTCGKFTPTEVEKKTLTAHIEP